MQRVAKPKLSGRAAAKLQAATSGTCSSSTIVARQQQRTLLMNHLTAALPITIKYMRDLLQVIIQYVTGERVTYAIVGSSPINPLFLLYVSPSADGSGMMIPSLSMWRRSPLPNAPTGAPVKMPYRPGAAVAVLSLMVDTSSSSSSSLSCNDEDDDRARVRSFKSSVCYAGGGKNIISSLSGALRISVIMHGFTHCVRLVCHNRDWSC